MRGAAGAPRLSRMRRRVRGLVRALARIRGQARRRVWGLPRERVRCGLAAVRDLVRCDSLRRLLIVLERQSRSARLGEAASTRRPMAAVVRLPERIVVPIRLEGIAARCEAIAARWVGCARFLPAVWASSVVVASAGTGVRLPSRRARRRPRFLEWLLGAAEKISWLFVAGLGAGACGRLLAVRRAGTRLGVLADWGDWDPAQRRGDRGRRCRPTNRRCAVRRSRVLLQRLA